MNTSMQNTINGVVDIVRFVFNFFFLTNSNYYIYRDAVVLLPNKHPTTLEYYCPNLGHCRNMLLYISTLWASTCQWGLVALNFRPSPKVEKPWPTRSATNQGQHTHKSLEAQGSLHTRAESRDHEIVRAQKKSVQRLS